MTLTPANHPLGPCPKGHDPFDPTTCSHCKQRVDASEWAGGGVPAVLPPPPCAHLGEATGETVQCEEGCGQGTRLKVFSCAVHGACTIAKRGTGVAGRCRGCKDFAPAPSPPVEGIVVPQPPAIAWNRRHPRALVTVVVGDEAERCFDASGPLMERYAREHDADLVVLDWPGHPAWPMSAKFAIPRVLDAYERIAYVDADALLRPGCVDLFAACGPDEFGACDELPFHRRQPQHGRELGYLWLRRTMGFNEVAPVPWYLNLGVYVASRCHRELLLPPATPIKPGHCAEQDWVNARLLDGSVAGSVRVARIDRRCNWQNWTDPGFKAAPPDAVLHWSGAGGNRVARADDMARVSRAGIA